MGFPLTNQLDYKGASAFELQPKSGSPSGSAGLSFEMYKSLSRALVHFKIKPHREGAPCRASAFGMYKSLTGTLVHFKSRTATEAVQADTASVPAHGFHCASISPAERVLPRPAPAPSDGGYKGREVTT